jgi:hypothetical protein
VRLRFAVVCDSPSLPPEGAAKRLGREDRLSDDLERLGANPIRVEPLNVGDSVGPEEPITRVIFSRAGCGVIWGTIDLDRGPPAIDVHE